MFDILIKNGKIVDGTGAPWFNGNIGIKDGYIKEIDPLKAKGKLEINASGKVVCPGFIDIHSHSDFNIVINPTADTKVMQGITTDVSGNCGASAAPLLNEEAVKWGNNILEKFGRKLTWRNFGQYLDACGENGLSVNYASFVGHHQVRLSVMGYKSGEPSAAEMDKMKEIVRDSIKAGALGLSSGLDTSLIPGCYAKKEEIVELCRAAMEVSPAVVYTSHMRNRQKQVLESIEEFIEVLKETGIRGLLSHVTPRYPDGDKTEAALKLIEKARKDGCDIMGDVLCPEEGYHTGFGRLHTQVMPDWAFNEGPAGALKLLKDPGAREKMKNSHDPLWGIVKERKWEFLYLTGCEGRKDLVGKNFAEIGKIENKDPWEAAFDILISEGENLEEVRISSAKHTSEKDTRRLILSPYFVIQTDRGATADYPPLSNFESHPNAWDGFPRFIKMYVRDENVLSLEDAIKKLTYLSARRLGLNDRGAIIEGMAGDLVVFDLDNLEATTTFKTPNQYPRGIEYVIVNGQVVVEEGQHNRALPGKVIKRL